MELRGPCDAGGEIRAQMGLRGDIVDFDDTISFITDVHAILIPVMWGSRNRHENALHIHLPDSNTTWVYLNLDTRIMDFKFWMAHELAHIKTPALTDSEAETFADSGWDVNIQYTFLRYATRLSARHGQTVVVRSARLEYQSARCQIPPSGAHSR